MLLTFLMFGDDWKISGTEIYYPNADVVFSEELDFYMHVFNENKIIHYDALGNRLDDIGREGGGPGEFSMLRSIFYMDGFLYGVQFRGDIQKFDRKGKFIKAIKRPERDSIVKVSGGWLTYSLSSFRDSSKDNQLTLYDESFENPVVLDSWPFEKRKMPDLSKKPFKMPYNPARDYPKVEVSVDGKTAFFYKPGKFEIKVIDVMAAKVTHTIVKKVSPTPFDEDWGEEMLARISKLGKGRIERVADFPEYYPAVQFLTIDAENKLWARPGGPRESVEPFVMDFKGNDIKEHFSRNWMLRVILIKDDLAYVKTFEDGEFGIKRTYRKNLAAFMESNPLEEDE